MHKLIIILALALCLQVNAQEISELASMPEAVSNNAVCLAKLGDRNYLYSFGGIDESKLFSGIHKRCYRYSLEDDSWESIPDLPSGNGRIAAGASFVKGKIYIFGGYEVFADLSERTFDEVHIFDPLTNDYLPNGEAIPVATDDHVQAVYKDSLIFLVSGWSDDTNIPNVQIYNPETDSWQMGTSTPDSPSFTAFGASGEIIGDTIYYSGGVRIVNGGFAMSNTFRKGYINPSDPTDITWESSFSFPSIGYRMAAGILYDREVIWIGGSTTGYNFDGLSYFDGQGVEPVSRILHFRPSNQSFRNTAIDLDLMDLRGLGQFNDYTFYLCGGMGPGQQVTDKTFKIEFSPVSNQEIALEENIVFPNPSSGAVFFSKTNEFDVIKITNLRGEFIQELNESADGSLRLTHLPKGIYFLRFEKNNSTSKVQKLIIN